MPSGAVPPPPSPPRIRPCIISKFLVVVHSLVYTPFEGEICNHVTINFNEQNILSPAHILLYIVKVVFTRDVSTHLVTMVTKRVISGEGRSIEKEVFEDTKGVIRTRKTRNRQHNGHTITATTERGSNSRR